MNTEEYRQLKKNIAWRCTFFELMESAAVITNIDGNVLDINSAFEKLYGWTLDEIQDKFIPIFPIERQYEFYDLISEILKGTKKISYDTMRMTKDRTPIPVRCVVSPVYDESGKIIALAAISEDKSEQIQTKQLIEEQKKYIAERENFLFSITTNIHEVIGLYDLSEEKILYISPSYEDLWGYKLKDLYENPMIITESFTTEDRAAVTSFYTKPSTVRKEKEFQIKTATGKLKWIHSKVITINDENHSNLQLIITSDITEIKEREAILRKWDKLGVVGQLAAGLAHELRNPLTSVKGFLQLIAQETDNQYNSIILDELERIEYILNEFLMLAKPHNTEKLNKENITNILLETITFMKPEALLHKVEIYTKLAQDLSLIQCEAKQLKQVFINIIKNAIEAMPTGGKIVIKTSASNGWITIKIIDHGIGIQKERLVRLGEPFYSTKEKGTGLGLMMSLKIIENHKGEITFSSEENKGTIVSIRLPSVCN